VYGDSRSVVAYGPERPYISVMPPHVRTWTESVYVVRNDNGCRGAAALQIPQRSQPATLPFWYGVRSGWPRDTIVAPHNGHPGALPDPVFRSTALRVTEPIWYEGARVVRAGMR
jgi:hypothetical protein